MSVSVLRNHNFKTFEYFTIFSYSFVPRNHKKHINVNDIQILNPQIIYKGFKTEINVNDITYSYDDKKVLFAINPRDYNLPKYGGKIVIMFEYIDMKKGKTYRYKEIVRYTPQVKRDERRNKKYKRNK